MAHLEFFHPARIALAKEVKNHPELAPLLNEHEVGDFGNRVGAIAATFGIMLDGPYTEEDIDRLCEELVGKLMQKRTITVVSDLPKGGH